MSSPMRCIAALITVACVSLTAPSSGHARFSKGQTVAAKTSNAWYLGTIVGRKGKSYRIQFKRWAKPRVVLPRNVKRYKARGPWKVGDFVAEREPNGTLYRATVTKRRGGKLQVHYVWDKSRAWVAAKRIQPAVAAKPAAAAAAVAAKPALPSFRVGQTVAAKTSNNWHRGRVVGRKGKDYRVQFKKWSKPRVVRARNVKRHKAQGPWKVGDFVAVREPNGTLYRGTVMKKAGKKLFVHYVWGGTKAWVTLDRVHPAVK
jgi:hypothetical protein